MSLFIIKTFQLKDDRLLPYPGNEPEVQESYLSKHNYADI